MTVFKELATAWGIVFISGVAGTALAADGITINGNTATSVTAAPGGGAIVKIAPATSNNISRNGYSEFSVDRNGVTLDNSDANARLILNEVTGSNRSIIEGAISVRGPQADVVLANPNGVTVNGGSFVNTGRTLITTGTRDGETLAGLPRYRLSGGDIVIGSSGLTAGGSELHLYAPEVTIDGALNGPASVEVWGGRGALTVGSDSLLGWIGFTQQGAAGRVTLNKNGVLSGGRITMTATGSGAGVNMAGIGLASAGNFMLSSDGKVTVTGRGTAQKTLFVSAADIEVKGTATAKARLASNQEAVQLIASKQIGVEHAQITGAGKGFFGFATNAAVSLRSGGDLTVSDAALQSVSSDIEMVSESAVSVQASTLLSSKDVIASARGNASYVAVKVDAVERGSMESELADVLFERSEMATRLGARLVGRNAVLTSSATERAKITASVGGVSFGLSGDLLNYGALVQGVNASEGDDRSRGGVTVTAAGNLVNETVSEVSIGSLFSQAGLVDLDVEGQILNRSGRILSEGGIKIASRKALENLVLERGETHSGIDLAKGTANFGAYAVGEEIGQITAVTTLDITAPRIVNHGGDIAANKITLSAATFENRPERFGQQTLSKSCFFFFCRRNVHSSVTHDGGNVIATDTLAITASTHALNFGGTLSGTNGITLTAPAIGLRGNMLYDSFSRPTGLRGLFRGKSDYLFLTYQPGSVLSEAGKVTFASANPTHIEATTFSQKDAPTAGSALVFDNVDDRLRALNRREIGFFRLILSNQK